MMRVPNQYRIRDGRMGSDDTLGNNGAFKYGDFSIIASDFSEADALRMGYSGLRWEHVSVSRSDRLPTWREMCTIKDMFWDGEDCVVQFHPPRSEYVNFHTWCLHLWRLIDHPFPQPPSWLVGPRDKEKKA